MARLKLAPLRRGFLFLKKFSVCLIFATIKRDGRSIGNAKEAKPMTKRITNKDLESLCEWINELHGVPNAPYSDERNERGGLVANAGVHYISGAYGGVRLEKMCKGGGSADVLSTGYGTKRELFNAMHNYIRGFRAAKEAA